MYKIYTQDLAGVVSLCKKGSDLAKSFDHGLMTHKQLIMNLKLTTFLLFIFILRSNAGTFAQQVSISKKNISLSELFSEINVQTGFDFLLEVEKGYQSQKIDVNYKNIPVRKLLDEVLGSRELSYTIKDRTILIFHKEKGLLERFVDYMRSIDVTGRVVDETNRPLIGAVVSARRGGQSIATDDKGNFLLKAVDPTDSLWISYLGYQVKKISVSTNIGVITLLPEVASLNEVTVTTGYQSLLKERAAGSFDQVNQDVLGRRPSANLSSALQGVVAGMQAKENADGSVKFLIRGNSSLYADRAPLVVIDGFPVGNSDFSTLNPNDVESVTVLKDASAASIWGARSANGVIVVTTKKGKAQKGLKIDANVFRRVSDLPKIDQLLLTANSKDHVAMERLGFQNNWFFGSSNYAGSFPTSFSMPLTLAQELLYANKNGKISTDVMNAKLDSLSRIDNKGQLRDLLLQRSALSQYNLTLSDASEKVKTYGSLLFEDSDTKYKGSGYNRFAFNLSNEYQATKFLTFNFGAYLQYRQQENSGATLSEMSSLSPYETLLNQDGKYSVNLYGQSREVVSMLPLNQFPYSDWSYNLLREVRGRDLKSRDYNARLQAGMNLKLLPGLSFDTKFQYERGKTDVNNYYNEDTYLVRNLVNTYLEYNNTTRTVGRVFLPKGGIGQSNNTEVYNYVFRNQLNFNRDLGTKHNINAISGMEISEYRTEGRINPWLYGYFPTKLQSSVPPYGYGSSVDQLMHVLGVATTLNDPLNPTSGRWGNTTLTYNLDRYVSYYANAAYTYNNRYTLSGSIRTDASNFITKISSLRWEPMWSVGGLWNIKRESFVDNVNWIDHLALRATYGRNGNVEKSSSTNTLLSVSTTPNANTGTITATIADNGNPTLRWEKTTTTNLGTDFAFFGSKLIGKIDAYHKLGTDITGIVALSSVTGTTSQRFNNAEIVNKGVEIELGTQLKLPYLPVTYNTSFNYAYNRNRVKSLYNPSVTASSLIATETAFAEGRPVNPIYSYTYAGTINGVPQAIGPNGQPYTMSTSGLAVLQGLSFLNYEGTATPPHTLGWQNNFRYNGLQLSFLMIGKLGGVYRNPTFNYDNAYVGSSKVVMNRFLSEVLAGREDIPPVPRVNENTHYNWARYTANLSGLVESSSYIELKEIMLDYTVSAKVSSKFGLRSLRLFGQVRDAGLVWAKNRNGYNPDWLPGTDRPLTAYTLGINLSL